ncbi:hypothetical protein GWK47_007979 [Chionoecetes opilio]|uniref:Uncharacterized protein n=1 Tax=Chionoecetes opilio TaxID=41210 RepID=A0A8J4XZ50_CHIOP|nr:hypothetical protein GWK47_007979 [Chionoecetes opilio]
MIQSLAMSDFKEEFGMEHLDDQESVTASLSLATLIQTRVSSPSPLNSTSLILLSRVPLLLLLPLTPLSFPFIIYYSSSTKSRRNSARYAKRDLLCLSALRYKQRGATIPRSRKEDTGDKEACHAFLVNEISPGKFLVGEFKKVHPLRKIRLPPPMAPRLRSQQRQKFQNVVNIFEEVLIIYGAHDHLIGRGLPPDDFCPMGPTMGNNIHNERNKKHRREKQEENMKDVEEENNNIDDDAGDIADNEMKGDHEANEEAEE